MKPVSLRTAVAAALGFVAVSAQAHTGHGTDSLFAGLAHPLGVDHLLAMLAVGAWSAAAFQGLRRWIGPACFLIFLALGAVAGVYGAGISWVEPAIAVSVVVFGALLAMPLAVSPSLGLVAVVVAAALHGLGHGAELPQGAGFGAYAAGFLGTTAVLHAVGLAIGDRLLAGRQRAWQAVGAGVAAVGLGLLAMAA